MMNPDATALNIQVKVFKSSFAFDYCLFLGYFTGNINEGDETECRKSKFQLETSEQLGRTL